MSIIAETLDRLEGDGRGSPDPLAGLHKDSIGPRRRAAGRGRLPLQSLMAVLVLAGGAGLAAWYWNTSPGGVIEPSLVEPAQPAQPDAPAAEAVAAVVDATPAPSEPLAVAVADNNSSDRSDPPASTPAAATASREQPQQTQALSTAVPAARPSDEVLAVIGIDPAVFEAAPVQGAGQTAGPSKPQSVETTVASENTAVQAPARQPSAAPVAKQAASPARPAAPAPTREVAVTMAETAAPASRQAPVQEAPAVAGKPAKPPVKKPANPRPESAAKAATVARAEPVAAKPRPTQPKSAPAQSRKPQKAQPAVAQQAPDAVDAAVEQARIALSQGQYPQALDALQALSPAPEKRADFWLLKGSSHLGLGQLDLAEQAFTRAQPLAPGNAQVAIQLAILKQEKGDHTGALKILAEAAGRHPNTPEIYLNQGYSQLELGAMRDAGRSFRVFLRLTEGRSLYAEQRKAVSRWLAQGSSVSG